MSQIKLYVHGDVVMPRDTDVRGTHTQTMPPLLPHALNMCVAGGPSVQFLIDSGKLYTGTITPHYEFEMNEKYHINITLYATYCSDTNTATHRSLND